MDKIPVGYKAICEKQNLLVLPHYRDSYIALQGRGKTVINNGHEIHLFPKSYALRDQHDLLEQLEFALKYDGINLEIIKAFFEKTDKGRVLEYIKSQPKGIYSRKIWFLYEFLMNEKLNIPDCQKIKYVDLLDPKIYFTSQPIKSSRHAINDNLLGNKHFCPIIYRNEILNNFINDQLSEKAKSLLNKYDPHLIARACFYLYTKETMSSYQIEREQPDTSRLTRFINMLQQASTIEVLSKEKLIELQNNIVDPRFKDTSYRQSQNYVGENVSPHFQKIHYISPKPEDVPELMQGLLDSLNRMLEAGLHPVLIAAVVSFGFVFIHPFEDGNGRIHRFLIHYVLSKLDFTPKNMIFPISSVMLKNMQDYDAILESFSKPLLSMLTNYLLSDEGVMAVMQDSKLFYQYINFTKMAEYLFCCINVAIDDYLEQEIIFLMGYDKAKRGIQEIVDMPDNKIDLLIKCVLQNNGSLSPQKKKNLFSLLTADEVDRLSEVIRKAMIAK